MSTPPTILIAGAGIGGLTAALALIRRGLRVRVIEQARERALVMARAAGEAGVRFIQLADPGLMGEQSAQPEVLAAAAPGRMRGAMASDQLAGIELQPADLTVDVVVQARFITD